MKKIKIIPVLLLLALCGLVEPLRAADGGVYTVSGIHVDVADETGFAREKAYQQAKAEAAQRLLQRLTLNPPVLTKMEAAQTAKWIDGIEVRNERAAAGRYSGDITVIFRPDLVEGFLQQKSIPFTNLQSDPVLVVPVYDRGDKSLLWEKENLWLAAWQKLAAGKSFGLVPVLVPQQDSDLQLADIEPALNAAKIESLSTRYGATQIAIAWARLAVKSTPTGSVNEISVAAQNLAGSSSPVGFAAEFPPGMALEDAFAAAAQQFLRVLEDGWKQKALSNSGPVKLVDVMVPLQRLEDWVQTEKKLRAMEELRKFQLRAISRDVAQLTLEVSDTSGDLPALFAKYNFQLTPGTGIWVLR